MSKPLKRFQRTPTRPLGTVITTLGHSTTIISKAKRSEVVTAGRWRQTKLRQPRFGAGGSSSSRSSELALRRSPSKAILGLTPALRQYGPHPCESGVRAPSARRDSAHHG